MKKVLIGIIAVVIIVVLFFILPSKSDAPADGVWDNALYTEDTEFGTGSIELVVKVFAGDKGVTFTLNTDKDNLAEALLEHKLIVGEDGPYGLYVKAVNGIVADYDVDKTYWSLTKDGEYMQTGASQTSISHGDCYEFTKTNG